MVEHDGDGAAESMNLIDRALEARGPRSILLIRLVVGLVFVSEGIQKFLFADALGVGRFAKIGIPAPDVMAPFVGIVEIVCGALVTAGLLTRAAAVPLVIDMIVAIATTKMPVLRDKGFWAMAHEARTDWSMLLGSLFLIAVGPGQASADARLAASRRTRGLRSRTEGEPNDTSQRRADTTAQNVE